MTELPGAVHALERELRGIFGSRLRSLVAYGLAANRATSRRGDAGEHGHTDARPPVQTLAIVEMLSADDLRACSGHVAGWHERGLATPLMIAAHEFERSLDAFPFEFGAIIADHVGVSGTNPFAGLTVEPSDLRRACEVQARGHLLHLREGYLETRGNVDALAVLVVRSAAPFAALVDSVARLDREDGDIRSAARHVERAIGAAPDLAVQIVELAGGHEMRSADAERMFPAYLDAVERLVKYVDQWT